MCVFDFYVADTDNDDSAMEARTIVLQSQLNKRRYIEEDKAVLCTL